MTANVDEAEMDGENGHVYVSMENLFLYTLTELEDNLGYLVTDQFASHPLRVLFVVLSGMPLTTADSTSLMQSKRKEHVTVDGSNPKPKEASTEARPVPEAFHKAVDKMIAGTVAGLDTNQLRALATHPIANPVLQLLLELELVRSGKQNAKDPNSLFRRLLPDESITPGTESDSFINNLIYDTIGSRLVEVIITHAPGKTFKSMYRSSFCSRLGIFAKNEIAAFAVIKIIERLNKEDLKTAVDQICPRIKTLIEHSRTSVIKSLIERCRIREVETQAISDGLEEAYGTEPSERLIRMLKVSEVPMEGMAEDRRKQLETQDASKVHGSLLAQCMLESPGPLRELIIDTILATKTSTLLSTAKDRTASRVLQSALVSSEQSLKFRRAFIPRLYGHIGDLAADTVASHVVDSLWEASFGLTFIRERLAEEIAKSESTLRASIPGRAVWRNWNMDIYKTRRKEWLKDGKDQDPPVRTGIELARERFASKKIHGQQKVSRLKRQSGTGANNVQPRAIATS